MNQQMKAVPRPMTILPKTVKIPAKTLTSANLATFLSTSWKALKAAEQKHTLRMAIYGLALVRYLDIGVLGDEQHTLPNAGQTAREAPENALRQSVSPRALFNLFLQMLGYGHKIRACIRR
jgi:hypothetical protein